MLNLEPIGSNMTLLFTDSATILFSYKTAVAAYLYGDSQYIRTDVFYSVTTSKHINKWLGNKKAEMVPQETIDNLLR